MTSAVRQVDVRVLRIPTDAAEADGTLDWDSTAVALVSVTSDDGVTGTG